MAKKKIGNQNPTTFITISTKNSDYKEAIKLYEESGRKCAKWQENLLKPLLSKTKQGLWTHTKFGYAVPRRNGKNEVVSIRELYGLMNGEMILHTAHRTKTTHTAWERLCFLLDKIGIEYSSLKALGSEKIEIKDTGGRIDFRTRTSTGGLGEGFDLLVIDEAQEYTIQHESALKYIVTSSKNPQTIMCGTPPTAVSRGTVFTDYRNKLIEGGVKNASWAEWAVDEITDVNDKQAWYKTNPSLGIIFTERSIEDEITSDDIDFNIQRLGLWIKYNQKSAILEKEWDELKVIETPKFLGRPFVGIKYGIDGINVALSVAIKTTEEEIFVEAIDCQSIRSGNDWIIQAIEAIKPQVVVIDGQSGQSVLMEDMKKAKLKPPLSLTVREIIQANSLWQQNIYNKSIHHAGQPSLRRVVTNCTKRAIGSNGGFGYSSLFDDAEIALMDSAILASYICNSYKTPKKQRINY